MKLLCDVADKGKLQLNKKGNNCTLDEPHNFIIELGEAEVHDALSSDEEWVAWGLMPLTTLRKIFPKPIITEALWYLRGEKDIKYLQNNNCHFWDSQAGADGIVGLNYGLLTNFPKDMGLSLNQLDEKVVKPLCTRDGAPSRNLIVTLVNPSEETKQVSCTATLQFNVRDGRLDLTLHQRSSDVMIGLPNDAGVWAVILHLVRREVYLRTTGAVSLGAGNLTFFMPAGAAHAYEINLDQLKKIRHREPLPNVAPHFQVHRSAPGLFELAKKEKWDGEVRIEGYTKESAHPPMQIPLATGEFGS